MKQLRFFAALLALGACFDPSVHLIENKMDFSVKDGRLVFRDAKALTLTINALGRKTDNELANWEKGVAGFSSWMSRHGVAVNASGLSHSVAFLSIVNHQGLYQVGGQVILLRGFTEYWIEGDQDGSITRMLSDPDHAPGVTKHLIRVIPVGKGVSSTGRTDGVDARYQRYAYKQSALGIPQGPYAACPTNYPDGPFHTPPQILPPPQRFKYVFESFVTDHSTFIELGVNVKLEVQQLLYIGYYNGQSTYVYGSFNISSEKIQKLTNLVFHGFTYDPDFSVLEAPAAGLTSGQLTSSVSFPGRCISDFRIIGIVSITSKDDNYFCPYNYKINGTNATETYPDNILWSDIRYCPSGAGGGSGTIGGEEPPPVNCDNGCVWSGLECVCA